METYRIRNQHQTLTVPAGSGGVSATPGGTGFNGLLRYLSVKPPAALTGSGFTVSIPGNAGQNLIVSAANPAVTTKVVVAVADSPIPIVKQPDLPWLAITVDGDVPASGVLTSDNTNVANNETVTIGGRVYTFKTNLTEETKASATVTDGNTTNLSDGDTITINGRVYRFKLALAQINDVLVVPSIAAVGTLTSDNTNPATTGTVTINDQTYTLVDTLSSGPTVANEVQISVVNANGTLANLAAAIMGTGIEGVEYSVGTVAAANIASATVNTGTHTLAVTYGTGGTVGNAIVFSESATHLSANGGGFLGASTLGVDNADATLLNLARAINHTGTEGTDYFTGTVINADVASSGSVVSHAITLTAKVIGTVSNAITLAKSAASLTLGNATGGHLNGGLDPIADQIKIGTDADTSLENLEAAINGEGAGTLYSTGTMAHAQVSSTEVGSHALTISAYLEDATGNTVVTTETSAHLSWGHATLQGSGEASDRAFIIDAYIER